MSKVKILPEILSNKIAAGEVVERPASVVKELVENALDANSSRIVIEVENGGRSLIRISDNGIGMSQDEALLSIERYATSKIYDDSDLFAIRTLGFRGEALPSIASVSRFQMETRDEASESGTLIEIEGGKLRNVTEIGVPTGTLISVGNLFFNTPARRKFLKTVNTEMGHIADVVAGMALGRPDVRFILRHNSKLVKSWTASDPLIRTADVLGGNIANDLHKAEAENEHAKVAGWVASPRIFRTTSRGVFLYVNGRCVRDRVVRHAIFEGYSGRMVKGRFPVAVIFITVPADRVDVNVHPTKSEVKFASQGKVHECVANAVSGALRAAERPKWAQNPAPVPESPRPVLHQASAVSESVTGFNPEKKEIPVPTEEVALEREEIEPAGPVSPKGVLRPEIKLETIREAPRKIQKELWARSRFKDLRVIGQFRGTYIVCESDEDMVLIDQHAAHERIYYERLKSEFSVAQKAVQHLLIPETMELAYSEAAIIEKLIPDLQKTGLEIEPFGDNTFVVKSVPALLSDREIRPLIVEIAEKIAKTGFNPGKKSTEAVESAMDECLKLIACHGAIRSNMRLSTEQIRALLEQLDGCENPSNCPHGRPTWIQWTARFIDKSFNRIV